MNYPLADLEKRLTEFQIVEDATGKIIGAIGFQMAERHGRIHSEAFSDFAFAESARNAFWGRVQNLASNHGILRLWTQENAPFWRQRGLQAADAEALKRIPEAWKNDNPWLTLRLKDEDAIGSIEKELAMMLQAEKDRTAQAIETGKKIKMFAMLLGLILAMFVIAAITYLLMKNPGALSPNK